jgi:hypothetical protein
MQQARFTLSEIILDSDSKDETGASQHAYGTLEYIMMDGDQFFDVDRNKMFSPPELKRLETPRGKNCLRGSVILTITTILSLAKWTRRN